ncbi:MAG: alginate export family protein [Hyphomonadaceae bacterium]|nr:alginate export family protein [Hyphomonadaceae bacterium]
MRGTRKRSWRALAGLVLATAGVAPAARAQEAWTLADALDPPDWLTVQGETRVRYETLDGQFRAGGQGGDQGLFIRTLLQAEADAGAVTFGLELQDARGYFDDAGTPLSGTVINPLDVLQAYARIETGAGPGASALTLGRQTLDIGSGRVVERADYVNAINGFTGAYLRTELERGDELHAFYVAPVGARPADRAGLEDNTLSGDEEEWGRRFWGVHYRRPLTFGPPGLPAWVELYLYGLRERDTADAPTPNRDYLQPGLRIARAPQARRVDFDVEASWRTGARRETADPRDVRDLDVSAWTVHAEAGYRFAVPWRLRASVNYDYASGDDAPGDGRFDQFERLFGARRTDLGHTGLFGPLTPANLSAPGVRFEIAPTRRTDARFSYKHASLAEARDAWVVARVRDPAGASGRFIGHLLDGRVRHRMRNDALLLEAGGGALLNGRFASDAPNASRQGDALYGYLQITHLF